MHLFADGYDPLTGQKVIDEQCHNDADGGVKDAVQGIADVRFHGCAEQNDAQHHAAGLHTARPVDQTQLNKRHDAQPQKQRQPMCNGDGGGFWFIGCSFVK